MASTSWSGMTARSSSGLRKGNVGQITGAQVNGSSLRRVAGSCLGQLCWRQGCRCSVERGGDERVRLGKRQRQFIQEQRQVRIRRRERASREEPVRYGTV